VYNDVKIAVLYYSAPVIHERVFKNTSITASYKITCCAIEINMY